MIKSLKERISTLDDQSSTADARKTWLRIWSTVCFALGNWCTSCSFENAFVFTDEGNSVKQRRKGLEKVCVADLSQRKFSVNDLQVQENCSREPISGLGGCRFGDTGEKVQVTKLRAIMAKAVFNPKSKVPQSWLTDPLAMVSGNYSRWMC